jgi:hypothetical protein
VRLIPSSAFSKAITSASEVACVGFPFGALRGIAALAIGWTIDTLLVCIAWVKIEESKPLQSRSVLRDTRRRCRPGDWSRQHIGSPSTRDLFGDYETLERTATVEKIREFINERLAGCFARVANGLVLGNSKSSPLYLLCFATANERGAPTALKIAQNILDE